jgi:hypothetical protein
MRANARGPASRGGAPSEQSMKVPVILEGPSCSTGYCYMEDVM